MEEEEAKEGRDVAVVTRSGAKEKQGEEEATSSSTPPKGEQEKAPKNFERKKPHKEKNGCATEGVREDEIVAGTTTPFEEVSPTSGEKERRESPMRRGLRKVSSQPQRSAPQAEWGRTKGFTRGVANPRARPPPLRK